MNFRIIEIKNLDSSNIYKATAVDGIMFKRIIDNVEIGLFDILFDSDYVINKISRGSDGVEFSIGDIININNTRRTIDYFIIHRNQLTIRTRGNIRTDLSTAIKYVEPVAQVRNVSTLEDIETRILTNNPRPIRLERLLKRRTETPKEFLVKFFKNTEDIESWNSTRNTIFVDDNTIQTPINKRRSMGDIYMILKYYYPNITLKEVIQLLYVDLMNELSVGLRTSNCSQIHKRVWYYDEDEGREFMQSGTRDEYRNNKEFYLNNLR